MAKTEMDAMVDAFLDKKEPEDEGGEDAAGSVEGAAGGEGAGTGGDEQPAEAADSGDGVGTEGAEDSTESSAAEQLIQLRAMIEEQAQLIAELRAGHVSVEEKKESKEADSAPDDRSKIDQSSNGAPDFMGGKDIDYWFETPARVNELLAGVFEQGRKVAKAEAEAVVRSIPQIVKHNVETQLTLTEQSRQFYSENEDLKGFKNAVGAVAQEILGKDPALLKDVPKFHKQLADEARRRLQLASRASSSRQTDGAKPGFTAPRGGPRGGSKPPTLSALEKDMKNMADALGLKG